MDEYLSCRYPHPTECDLVVDGQWCMGDVGWRMAYDRLLEAWDMGFDGFIFPPRQTPEEFYPWNIPGGPKKHYLRIWSERNERS